MIERQSLLEPDQRLTFGRQEGAFVRVGSLSVGRTRLGPGWRWSVDVGPAAGTTSCQVHHLNIVLSGSFGVRLDDGEEAVIRAGDVVDIPPGHDAWVVGDEPVELLDVSGNAEAFGARPAATGVLLTILMTDIAGSTELADRLGDAAWRQVLERHNRVVRAELSRFRGTEIDTTGDGFLATFQSAAGALDCARAIRDVTGETGVAVRIGVHTGEIEVAHGDVRGIAVHAASRVMASGEGGQVVVSGVTRALASGGSFAFRPLGTRQLKGIATPFELFALE